MQTYHNAFAANSTGLPKFCGVPSPEWLQPANSNNPDAALTDGGRIVFQRTRRPVATCNLLARLAGIGQEAAHHD